MVLDEKVDPVRKGNRKIIRTGEVVDKGNLGWCFFNIII